LSGGQFAIIDDVDFGYYSTEVEAAVAYDAAAMHHFGEFAATNFTYMLDNASLGG
jgi:hypothetical protein